MKTNFQCPYYAEEYYPGDNKILSGLTTPTGDKYGFTWEPTHGSSGYITGRIQQITFPSGGSISYSYSGGNNGINCTSGVVPTLTVTVSDNNGNLSKYTYVNSNNSYKTGNFTVIKTDPAGNQTLYSFAGEYQTQAAVYEGGCPTSTYQCTGGGTLLKTTTICYGSNGSAPPVPPNCTAPSTVPFLPITETDVYTSVNGSSSNRVKTTFDSYRNATSTIAYDFGATTPTTQRFMWYGQSWNGTSCTAYSSSYIRNTPCYVQIEDGSSNILASTQITYSNTGHPTSVSKWVSGSNWLTTSMGYGANGAAAGVLSSMTDVNGTLTSLSAFTCNGMLPTSMSVSGTNVSLSGSESWDCNGGVPTSLTDANGKITTTNFTSGSSSDPLYRPLSVVDPLNNTTAFSYTATTFESAMNFNGAVSTTDMLTTKDGVGRNIFGQKRQGQGSSTFDTTWYAVWPFCPAFGMTRSSDDMAKSALERAIELSDSGHVEDALRELEARMKSTNDTKEKAFLLLTESTFYLMLARPDDAERALRQVKLLAPQDAEVCLSLDYQKACVLIAQKKLNQGLLKFEFILKEYTRISQDPGLRYMYEDIQQRRAFALVGLELPMPALPILEECLSFSFDDQKDEQLIRLYLGTCHYELGQYDLAKNRFIEVIRYNLGNNRETEACYRLAAIHFREGALAQAKLRLEEVVCTFGTATEPDVPRKDVYDLLSKTCKFLGETDNAERYSRLAKT